MVKELKASLQQNIYERLSSPFYGTFAVSWLLWNWKIWYITFFVDSELLFQSRGILKIEYIIQIYSISNDWLFFLLHIFILPLASAFVIVFYLPYLTSIFLEKWLEFKNKNELIEIKKSKELLKEKEEKLEVTKNIVAAEKEVIRTVKEKKKTEEDAWAEDYENFRKSSIFAKFRQIEDAVYIRQGRSNNIETDIKSYADVLGLIKISTNKYDSEIVSLTDKGKYFLKKFKEDSPF